jgi:hypothetical protein
VHLLLAVGVYSDLLALKADDDVVRLVALRESKRVSGIEAGGHGATTPTRTVQGFHQSQFLVRVKGRLA